jgi:hypothetical protein
VKKEKVEKFVEELSKKFYNGEKDNILISEPSIGSIIFKIEI